MLAEVESLQLRLRSKWLWTRKGEISILLQIIHTKDEGIWVLSILPSERK